MNEDNKTICVLVVLFLLILLIALYARVTNNVEYSSNKFQNYVQMIEYHIKENEELINKSGNAVFENIQPQINNYISLNPDSLSDHQYFYKQKIERKDNKLIYSIPIENDICIDIAKKEENGSCIKKQDSSIYQHKIKIKKNN